jgi:hypothetical protein
MVKPTKLTKHKFQAKHYKTKQNKKTNEISGER